jgi:hypothetical protein
MSDFSTPGAAAPTERIGRRTAALTVCCLGGSVFFVFPALYLFNRLTPGFAQDTAPWLFLALLALSCGGGAYAWATRLARIAGGPARRQAWAAAAGFGLTAPGAVYFLPVAESLSPHMPGGGPLPVHVLFAIVFPMTAFVVSGTTAFGITLARGGGREAVRTALAVASVAMLTFLAVDVAFDLAGMRIGAPGAEKRATMLVVMGCGLLVSALSAGALLGRSLARMRPPAPRLPAPPRADAPLAPVA